MVTGAHLRPSDHYPRIGISPLFAPVVPSLFFEYNNKDKSPITRGLSVKSVKVDPIPKGNDDVSHFRLMSITH